MMSGNPGPHGWKTDPTTTVSQEGLLVVIAEDKVAVSVSLEDATIKTTTVSRSDGTVSAPQESPAAT